jgi:hypothetical protein
MTPRENLRRAMEEYLARRYPGTRWSVGLAGDEPAQAGTASERVVDDADTADELASEADDPPT